MSGGVWSSMSLIARENGGAIIIDLGFFGAGRALENGLARLDLSPQSVYLIFLTHSHADHISGWRLFPNATFIMSAAESSAFVGGVRHKGPVVTWAERLFPTDLPKPGQVRIMTFTRDTAFILGSDTVRAYSVPGHTAGSAAYDFHHTLFIGDAVTMLPVLGFRGARRMYSDDTDRSRASVAALWSRVPLSPARTVCVAHGKCVADSEAFRRDALR